MTRSLALATCLAALCLAALLGGCAANVQLAQKPVLYVDEWVRRPDPSIIVRPENSPISPLSAVIVPLRVAQSMDMRHEVGRGVTRVIWQTWLADKVFPGLAFDEQNHWTGPDAALKRHARSGADLVIGGTITNIMFGGTAGETTISLTLEIYDARTGALLWSMAHAGMMANAQTMDYILLDRVSRLPDDPLHAIVTVLAHELGEPVRLWNQPPPPEPDEDAGPAPKPLG